MMFVPTSSSPYSFSYLPQNGRSMLSDLQHRVQTATLKFDDGRHALELATLA